MDYICRCSSPLGEVLLACDGEALVGLWFAGQKHYARGLSPECREEAVPVLEQTRVWLERYFEGFDPGPLPPLQPRGTAFQQEVWQLLNAIPRGQTRSYGDLARRLAQRRGDGYVSPRAVGGAVGRNPISILIPCHRVTGANGSLTGYAGGLDRKQALLALELKEGAQNVRFPF